jgi:hypothetical protein
VTTALLVVLFTAALAALALSVRRWHARSDARRLAVGRAMAGDTEIIRPDHESTLAISVAASPAAVWDALLRFGWPPAGHRGYEWLGRSFGYLRPAGSTPAVPPPPIPIGRDSEIPVRAVVPSRTLVLGGAAGSATWAWQFEVAALDEQHTRIILRDRLRRGSGLPAWLSLALRRPVSFLLTRKMLLDIKLAAEADPARVALPLTR